MTRKDYTQEFKEQILRECQEVGNVIKSISVCKIPRLDELSVLG